MLFEGEGGAEDDPRPVMSISRDPLIGDEPAPMTPANFLSLLHPSFALESFCFSFSFSLCFLDSGLVRDLCIPVSTSTCTSSPVTHDERLLNFFTLRCITGLISLNAVAID